MFDDPELTQKQTSKRLRFSDSTIKRYRKDISMKSSYNGKNPQKVTPKLSRVKCGKCDNENITFLK